MLSGNVFLSEMVWKPLVRQSWGGVELCFLAGLLLYAWIILTNQKAFSLLLRFLFSPNDFAKPMREGSSSLKLSKGKNFFFLLLNIFSGAGILYLAGQSGLLHVRDHFSVLFPLGGENLSDIVVAFLAMIFFYVSKRLLLFVFSETFEERKFSLFVWRTWIYYDWVYTLLAFPVSALFLHSPVSVYRVVIITLLIVYMVLFFIKILKALLVGSSYSRFSRLHIFSYLCALEMLPLLCIWQLFYGV